MRTEFYYDSCGTGQICAYQWQSETEINAIVQIVHGIAEHAQRYDNFAEYLNSKGIMVVAEDHMGHGKSKDCDGLKGYFHGGWFAAVDDTYALMQQTMAANPGVPYILFGHSMGSFMARTILAKYPQSGIAACVICGTAWQPEALLRVAIPLCKVMCRNGGDKKPSPALQKLMFGSYNKRVEHPRTPSDWLTRDPQIVDIYEQDPNCGFVGTAGLYRDMLTGIDYIQKRESLQQMNKSLPVLFIAGGDDPVGNYGKGIAQAVQAFCDVNMEDVSERIYPLCRHEILNEINSAEVFEDVYQWILKKMP